MNSETSRIAEQMRQAFNGRPWHGTPLAELLSGITAEQAHVRPLPSAHSIWEIVLHLDLWMHIAVEAISGVPVPQMSGADRDWLTVIDSGPSAWTRATNHLAQLSERFARAVETFPESRLRDPVPGRDYSYLEMFQGLVNHGIYHGGQIAILKRSLEVPV